MAGGADVVLRHLDLAFLVYEERRTNDALVDLAVVRLLSKRTPGLQRRLLLVGEQRECQLLLVAELGELGRLVGGDADDLEAVAVELGQTVAEVAGLLGAARGARGGVEVHDHLLAGVVGERDIVAVGIGQGERRSGVARLELAVFGHRTRVSKYRRALGSSTTKTICRQVGGHVAKDTDRIEREIEAARNQLASTLDELSVRASPKNIVANTKQTVVAKLNEPAVKFTLLGVGAVVAVLVVRRIFN